jgi:DNA primase
MRKRDLALVIAALLLASCGKAKPPDEDNAGTDFVAEIAQKDLPLVKAGIAAGKPGDVIFKCAGMSGVADLRKVERYQALAKDLTETCEHDLPLARMKVATEKAEAARKAKPDEKVLSECFSAELQGGLDDLRSAKREDGVSKALLARFQAACPNQK